MSVVGSEERELVLVEVCATFGDGSDSPLYAFALTVFVLSSIALVPPRFDYSSTLLSHICACFLEGPHCYVCSCSHRRCSIRTAYHRTSTCTSRFLHSKPSTYPNGEDIQSRQALSFLSAEYSSKHSAVWALTSSSSKNMLLLEMPTQDHDQYT